MKGTGISEAEIRDTWYTYLTTGDMPPNVPVRWYKRKSLRPLVKRLPRSPRCNICYFPFYGIGGFISKNFLGIRASNLNPNLCNLCEKFAARYQGGAELEAAVMFVDVRNSTAMAEKMSPEEFSKHINRFYKAVTHMYYQKNGLVEKFQGDEVGGFFVRGMAGPEFATNAVKTAKHVLKTLGYGTPAGPWIDVGIGIHTGMSYIGGVTTISGIADISILGDTVNTAARLTSHAAPGQIIISEETRNRANMSRESMKFINLRLKGKSTEIDAWMLKV